MLRILVTLQSLMLPFIRAVLGVLAAVMPQRFAPQMAFPKPAGPHGVGVQDIEFTYDNPRDTLSSGKPRRLMARIWYPAKTGVTDGVQNVFANAHEMDVQAKAYSRFLPLSLKMAQAYGNSKTWSWPGALVADSDGKLYPLIIFGHGLSGIAQQNVQLCEHWASHGYVVVSLAHPIGASAVAYPSGGEAEMTWDQYQALTGVKLVEIVMALMRGKTMKARYAAMRRHAEFAPLAEQNDIWAADVSALIDYFQREDIPEALASLLQHTDLHRIAATGMSFGGCSAAQAAHEDERISAAINLDGGQYGTALYDTQIRTPLLMLHAESSKLPDGGTINDYAYEPRKELGESGRVFRFIVAGSGHISFTDLATYPVRIVGALTGQGTIDGARMHSLMAECCTAFLDKYLKGNDHAWPENPGDHWPEISESNTAPLKNAQDL